MHSKQNILNRYPFYEYPLMDALPFYYGQVNQHDLENNTLDWDELGNVLKELLENSNSVENSNEDQLIDLTYIRKKTTSYFLM